VEKHVRLVFGLTCHGSYYTGVHFPLFLEVPDEDAGDHSDVMKSPLGCTKEEVETMACKVIQIGSGWCRTS